MWLPTRVSALGDILSNTLGGILGALLFLLCGTWLLDLANIFLLWLRKFLTPPMLGFLFLAFCLLTLKSPLHMRHLRQDLANWNWLYPLSLGNTPEGSRPWHGTISRLEIAADAIAPSDIPQAFASPDLRDLLGERVLASYRPAGLTDTPDLTHHSPSLRPVTTPPADAAGSPLLPSGQVWLSTVQPLAKVNAAIARSNRFSLPSSAPATASGKPSLPILTLSPSTLANNFTLGQQGFDLVIRLRTPLTGDNGADPAWHIRDLFRSPVQRDLLIVYDDPALRVYIDSPANVQSVDVPVDFGGITRFLVDP